MKHLNYIPADGYTEQGYIEPVPQLYDRPLRFTFRPLLPEERAEHLTIVEKLSGVKNELACNAFVADRLRDWDHVDRDGKPIPISAVSVGRLKPALAAALYRMVLGVQPSDLDPLWSEEEKGVEVGVEYQSAKFGVPVGDVKLQEAEKNLSSG